MRLFVCSLLGDEAQEFYRRLFAGPVLTSGGLLRDIPARSAHITYVFMGEVTEESLGSVVEAVTAVAARHDATAISLGAPAIQFARAEARLVYAPLIEGAEAISNLTTDIVRELASVAGSGLDLGRVDGSKSPHVTLARFRTGTHRRTAAPFLDTLLLNRVVHGGDIDGDIVRQERIAEVQVVASELTSAGPRYDVKARVRLGVPQKV